MALLAILGCKTRKVATENTQVHTSTTTEATAHAQRKDSISIRDNTTRKDFGATTATIEADSIVSTPGKTVIYPIKGKPFVYHATTGSTVDNNIITNHSQIVDSVGVKKQVLVSDSTHKTRVVDAKGSGTVFAYTMPIVAGAVLLLAFLGWLYFRQKRV